MPLPTLSVPHFDLTVPSSGKSITVRPFVVREEKILLMALESKDSREIINTTKQIVKSCIIDANGFDVEKAPYYDIDYLFIALRAKSVGESISIKYTCKQNDCGNTFPANINISNVQVIKPDIPNIVEVAAGIRIKLKVPNYTQMKSILDSPDIMSRKIKLACASVEYIQEKEKFTTPKDVTPEELQTFMEGLTQEKFAQIEHWTNNFPSFQVITKATCNKCGFEHSLVFNEFIRFFE